MNGSEPEGADDHGGRLEAAVLDDPAPYEGTDWLTDDPDGKGEFTATAEFFCLEKFW